MGTCVSREEKFTAIVEKFEKNLAFTKVTFQELEERVKRLACEEDYDTV